MQLPKPFLNSLQSIKGFEKEAFEKVHASGKQVTSIRINSTKKSQIQNPNSKIDWTEFGYYLDTRPSFTFDPLFHAGCYYVQEASSMFLEEALKQTVDLARPLKVLDLCAAPGGKSTHIQSLISKDSLLVSNEIIRSRVNILKDNIIKWGCENVMVTMNDPHDFAKLENYFDVIVVDAPCSGSGLFRKDADAINEWSENNVQLCSQRQQRILADVFPSLKKDGILIYSTCSYSKEEDEEIMDWMTSQLPTANEQLTINKSWGIVETKTLKGNAGYRFWPDKVKGEGFFISCFRKTEGDDEIVIKNKIKPESLTNKETEIVSLWINKEDHKLIKNLNTVYAWPEKIADDFSFLLNQLRVIYSGVIIGELMRDKLIPDHALAMSKLITEKIDVIDLSLEQAINYLKRKDFQAEIGKKGWQLVSFNGQPLGWVNVLSSRINNYYPKELRILKDN
jgi:NOL1/NOP2/sun family putative RNA methylase